MGGLVVLRTLTSLNGQDLLGHHREHLQVDAVELIKAGPGTTGEQALPDGPSKGKMGHVPFEEGQVSLKHTTFNKEPTAQHIKTSGEETGHN